MQLIGIVGSGQMGSGIAQIAAQKGIDVALADASLELAMQGRQKIQKSLAKLTEKGKISAGEAEGVLARILPVGSLKELSKCEFIVEAATERADLKLKIFRELDELVNRECILASNTSSISITTIAAATKRPAQVVGMHFMNPVPVMKLVEGIRGLRTSDATFTQTRKLAEALEKTFIEANDFPGFLVNRILMPMINEAVYALYEGVGGVSDIDTAMKLGTNQPMGPLALADFIGLDTCLAIMNVLQGGLGDTKYRACPLLKQYVDAGLLGKKSGMGFYDYRQGEAVVANPRDIL